MPSLISRITLLASLIASAGIAVGEILVMPNGDRISGKPLPGNDDGRMRFSSPSFGIIDLPLGVARVESDPATPLKKQDESAAKPPVYREGWGGNSFIQGGTLFESNRVPYEEPVTWLDHWKHRVTGGIIQQNGEVDVTSRLAYYEGIWNGHENEFRGLLDYMKANQKNPDGTEVNVGNRLKVEGRLRHDLDTDFFTESTLRYRRDYGQGIARRVLMSQGIGYRYLSTEHIHAAVVLGGAIRSDYYLRVDHNNKAYKPYAYVSEELEWLLAKNVILRHDFTIIEKIGPPETFSLDTGVELEIALSRHFGLSFRYAMNYEINRVLNVNRYQDLYSTGIIFRF